LRDDLLSGHRSGRGFAAASNTITYGSAAAAPLLEPSDSHIA
jgi:hypothetical protein